MEETIEVTIVNWEKYNPASDEIRRPHWFRLNQDIAHSDGLQQLSAKERWVFVILLSERCKKKSKVFKISPKYFSRVCKVQVRTVIKTLYILSKNGTIILSKLGANSELTPPTGQDKTGHYKTKQDGEGDGGLVQNSATEEVAVVAVKKDGFLKTVPEVSKKAYEAWLRLYPNEEWLKSSIAYCMIEISVKGNGTPFANTVGQMPLVVRLNKMLASKWAKDLANKPHDVTPVVETKIKTIVAYTPDGVPVYA